MGKRVTIKLETKPRNVVKFYFTPGEAIRPESWLRHLVLTGGGGWNGWRGGNWGGGGAACTSADIISG